MSSVLYSSFLFSSQKSGFMRCFCLYLLNSALQFCHVLQLELNYFIFFSGVDCLDLSHVVLLRDL